MCNPFDTGSPTVDRMCRLQFTGNVIPSSWYHTIKKGTGKPNLNAIIILADIVYWYRPVEIRDEATGQLCGFKKKFQAEYFTAELPADCRAVWDFKARRDKCDCGVGEAGRSATCFSYGQYQRTIVFQCDVSESGCG